MLIWDDNDLILVFIHRALSLLIAKCQSGACCCKYPVYPIMPPLALVVLTRGSNFTDCNVLVACLAALHLNAMLQCSQHPLLRELWHDLQVFNWYIKLGPVVGNYTLTSASRNEREMVERRNLNWTFRNELYHSWKSKGCWKVGDLHNCKLYKKRERERNLAVAACSAKVHLCFHAGCELWSGLLLLLVQKVTVQYSANATYITRKTSFNHDFCCSKKCNRLATLNPESQCFVTYNI